MEEKLLIFQKTYEYAVWLYFLLNRLPRNHRPILGQQIHSLALAILVGVVDANTERDVQQRKLLQMKISRNLDTLRILIRLTKDVKLMSIKQYAFAADKMNEIGRMLSAWIKVS